MACDPVMGTGSTTRLGPGTRLADGAPDGVRASRDGCGGITEGVMRAPVLMVCLDFRCTCDVPVRCRVWPGVAASRRCWVRPRGGPGGPPLRHVQQKNPDDGRSACSGCARGSGRARRSEGSSGHALDNDDASGASGAEHGSSIPGRSPSASIDPRFVSLFETVVHVVDVTSGGTGGTGAGSAEHQPTACLLYTSPSPRDATLSRMPSSA